MPEDETAGFYPYEQAIREDDQQQSPELIEWSFLYHYYVRTELNISIKSFSEYINQSERTVRRYKSRAIARFTNALIRREWDARQVYRSRRLLAAFPQANNRNLIGRDEEVQRVLSVIEEKFDSKILIVGSPGIGKTSLVQEILCNVIETDGEDNFQLDTLVWVDNPPSIESVYHKLYREIGDYCDTIDSRSWMVVYRTAIVIDNIDALISDKAGIETFLDHVDPALVFLICKTRESFRNIDLQLILDELDLANSKKLLETVASTTSSAYATLSVELVENILQQVGGNPLGIRLAVQDAVFLDGRNYPLNRLWDSLFSNVSDQAKSVWIALALSPPMDISDAMLFEIWGGAVFGGSDVDVVVRRSIVAVTSLNPRKIRLVNSARQFIASCYLEMALLHEIVVRLLAVLLKRIQSGSNSAVQVGLYTLTLKWLSSDEQLRSQFVASILNLDERSILDHDPHFYQHLNSLSHGQQNSFALNIAYAVALRKHSRLGEASNLLERIIAETGREGDFVAQAEARLELAVTQRYLGEYDGALSNLDQVEFAGRRFHNEHLKFSAILELTQIAVDRLDISHAKKLRAHLVYLQGSTRGMMLLGEIFLLEHEYEMCLEISDQLITAANNSRRLLGRIYDFRGRVLISEGKYELAEACLETSQSYFQTEYDAYELARSLTNLVGFALIWLKKYERAAKILSESYNIQEVLGDTLGLAVTKRNLRLLDDNSS
jgi:AAA+ ATPase superfamily predicted ATPase